MPYQPRHFSRLLLLLGLWLTTTLPGRAQEQPTHKLEFLRAVRLDPAQPNDVVVVLQLTPAQPSFKPILSTRIAYRVGQAGPDTLVNILKQPKTKVALVIYGTTTLAERDPQLYQQVKDKMSTATDTHVQLLAFRFKNVPPAANDPAMSVTYGIWETIRKKEVRNEQTYTFTVE